MWKGKGNNKESDENNKKTTQGRKTIRTMKSKTLKSGDRPSTCVCNCRRMICSADRFCRKGMCMDRREMDEATTMKQRNNEET